jgi:hypothetical protein
MPQADPSVSATVARMRAIHAARRRHAHLAEDDAWRQFLSAQTGLNSLRAMDGGMLDRVLDALHAKGRSAAGSGAATAARPIGHRKHDPRPQARMALGLWIELSRAGVVHDRTDAGLDAFCKRTTGRDALRWCDAAQLGQVVEALKAMRGRASADLPPAEPRDGETEAQAQVRALWDALRHSGAMRTGANANLDTWLLRCGYGVRHVHLLSTDQAAEAVARLAAWWRKHQREAARGA